MEIFAEWHSYRGPYVPPRKALCNAYELLSESGKTAKKCNMFAHWFYFISKCTILSRKL